MGRIVNMGYLDNFHYIALEPLSGRLDILSIPSTHSNAPHRKFPTKEMKRLVIKLLEKDCKRS